MATERALHDEIEARVREFDVSSLLLLLDEIAPSGRPYAIARAGHPARSPQPAWLEAIAFEPQEDPSAVSLTANLGLASCRSPLPDYFCELFNNPDVRDPLRELLSLLDDRLLERRFASYRPEDDRTIFPSFADTRRDMLCLGALRSPAALRWLFQKIYPELRVTVRRAPQDRALPAPDARLGAGVLGRAALGGRAVVPVRAIEVLLACRDHLSPLLGADGGRAPWAAVAGARLRDHVFPALRGAGVHLTVWLVLLDGEARARIADRVLPDRSYVGYDPMRGRKRVRFRRRLRLLRDGAARRLPRPPRFRPLRRPPWAVVRARLRRSHGPPARVLIFAGPVVGRADRDE